MSHHASPELFFDTVTAYQKSAALKAAIEVGLFTAIGAGKHTAADMAAHCRIAQRGARILADYLVTLGFLTKQQDHYALSPDSAAFLDQNSPAYIGAAVEFMDSPHLRDCFDALPDRVRAGGAPLTRDNALAPSHESWVKFARGMAGIQTLPARLLAQHVLADQPKEAALRVLDVAAGHGMFGISILQQHPAARVVALDWANVLEVAKENAAKLHVLERCELLPGSVFEADLRGPYDIILVPNLLHHFDPPANITMLKRLHAALKPGGKIEVLEFVPNENRISPETPARFSLVMLATTPAGDAYTYPELKEMLTAAGFSKIALAEMPPMPSRIVSATR